jgi:hypothetical protein
VVVRELSFIFKNNSYKYGDNIISPYFSDLLNVENVEI